MIRPHSASSPLWRNLSFTLMWTSVFASGFGDRIIQLAAWPLLGMNEPGSETSAIQASVTFFFFLPFPFFGPIGGWLADLLPRKWIMLGCDEARALVILAAALLLWRVAPGYDGQGLGALGFDSGTGYLAVYLAVALTGAFAAIFSPARDATVPQIVPFHQLTAANAVILAFATVGALIGIGVGQEIIRLTTLFHALAVGVACFAISGGFWAFVRPRKDKHLATSPDRFTWRGLIEAGRYLASHRRVRQLYLLAILFWALAGVLIAGLAALCGNVYALEPEDIPSTLARLQFMVGMGMLCSSLALMAMRTLREAEWIMLLALAVCGPMILLLWGLPYVTAGLVLSFALGFASNILRVLTESLMQAITPNYIRGRLFGMRDILTTSSIILVNLVIWRIPHADEVMLVVLPILGGLVTLAPPIAVVAVMRRGPLGDPVINVIYHIVRAYTLIWHHLRWEHKHRVPSVGGAILAPNHTTGIDGLVVQSALTRLVRWVMLSSYRFSSLEFMWKRADPVTLDDDTDNRTRVREVVRALRDGKLVGMYPEGSLQREVRELKPLKGGVILVAKRSGCPIIPTWIEGTPKVHAMLWHFVFPSRTRVYFGEPYHVDPDQTAEQALEELRRRLLALETEARSKG